MASGFEKSVKHLFDFYLNSSIHVALAVTAFALITTINLRLQIDTDLLFFIFFSTVAGYNLTKYTGSHKSPEAGTEPSRSIVVFTSICLAPLLYFTILQPWPVILLSFLMGLITISYSWPLLSGDSNLRDIFSLKIFVIAIVWATVTVLLPAVSCEYTINSTFIIEFIQRFIFVIVLTLPFDIRDVRFDTYQLGTIPQVVGIKKSRVLGVVLLCLVLIIEFLKSPFLVDHAIILTGISLLTAYLVMKSVVKQTKYYASFWVESIPIIWCGLLILI